MGELAVGGQASVRHYYDTVEEQQVVIKTYRGIGRCKRVRTNATLERDIMMSLNHVNIHRCIDYFHDGDVFSLVTEPLVCDLFHILIENGKALEETDTRIIFRQILRAV
jgi:serine/threonine protein kinase